MARARRVGGAAGPRSRGPRALALVVGVVSLAAGLLRLGFVATAISEPVLRGFIMGVAITIRLRQVPGLLGAEGGVPAGAEGGLLLPALTGVVTHGPRGP